MTKIITVVNQKGGVGKSTISQFTGNELRARGYEVLFIDLDPQGNLSYSLGVNILELETNQTIYEPLTNGTDAGKAVLLVSFELDEVMNLSDRILVMYEGEIVGELDPRETDSRELGLYMAGQKKEQVV